MQIANPIYDVVFKYLMEDSKLAKLMISSIIGANIERLSFLPQEFISDKEKPQKVGNLKTRRNKSDSLTVYRLDFSAKIKTSEGHKNVIVELQKAKFPTDIMRFRSYLGQQFANKNNFQKIKIDNHIHKTGLPIISIYFLGHKLDNTTASAIKVSRQYSDLITDEIIDTKESFIESLTLDSYVIQIPYLTDKRRSELEILLSVFDQRNPADKDRHILNVREEDFPLKYRPIIRKLQKAILDNEVKKRMDMEDGIIDELEDMKREIEGLELKVEEVEQENLHVKQEYQHVKHENLHVKQEYQNVKQENQLLQDELEKLRKLLNDNK